MMAALEEAGPHERSDAELLGAVAAGDFAAAGALFDRHEPGLRRYLCRVGQPGADVDDLVQATFLEITRAGEPFRRGPVLALALLAAGVGLFELSRSVDVPRPPVATVAAPAPTYRLSATSSTRWRILESGAALRLRLDIGDVELQVDKLPAGQRFVLELPDGEVEVVGTRFRAVASALGTEQCA